MKQQALAASDTSLNTTSRQALNANFQALLQQITTVVKNAMFNGFNLIDGSTNRITALASADGQHRITVQAENMSLSGPIVTISAAASISTQSQASAMINTVETSLNNVDSALASLGSGSAKFSIQATFVQNLSDTLTTGIGNLVDANMADGKRQAHRAADQAAARRAGSVDRQPGAADHPVAVPLSAASSLVNMPKAAQG